MRSESKVSKKENKENFAEFLGYSAGLVISWSSPILMKLQSSESPFGYPISTTEASWITSLYSLGSTFSPLPFAYISNKLGRKPALILSGFLLFISFLILAFAKDIRLYYAARFVSGLSIGGYLTVIGMYCSEIAHHEDRTFLNSMGVGMLMFGMLVPYLVGPYMPVMWFNLFCAFFPALFCFIFTFFVYETPPFLLMVGKKEKAAVALKKLRGISNENIDKEISETLEYIKAHEKEANIFDLIKNRVMLKCLGVAIFLVTVQHVTGILPIICYTQEIFASAGIGISSDVSSIIVNGTQFLFCFGVPFVAQRFRFRMLLSVGTSTAALSLGLLGLYFYLHESTEVDTSSISWLPILSMITTLVSYIYGISTIPRIVMTALFPTNIRSLAISITYIVGSFQGFLENNYFLPVAEVIGMAWCFWFFAICCTVSAVCVLLFVPETNGKTFQNIQDELRNRGKVGS